MATSRDLTTDAAIAPGELLREELEAREMTQKDLATRMGRPAQMVSEICRGKKEITPDTALDLEEILDIPAYVWLSLESEYRVTLARRRRAGPTRGSETSKRRR